MHRHFAWMMWPFLLACGSGGSDARGVVSTTLAGRAFFEGPLAEREVAVFDFEGGVKGTELGRTGTDQDGRFAIELGPLFGDFLVEVSSSDGSSDGLSAVVDGIQIGDARTDLQVTPVTKLVTAYAAFLLGEGRTLSEAALSARQLLFEHFGGIDHAAIEAVDPRAGSIQEVSDGVIAGILLSGLSEQARLFRARGAEGEGRAVSTGALASAYARDLEDGVFDGKGRFSAELMFSGVPLEVESLRLQYANAIVSFLESSANATGLGAAELAGVLDGIRTNESILFPPGSAAGRDQEGPEIVSVAFFDEAGAERPEGIPVRGRVQLRVRAEDPSGVAVIRASEKSTVIEDTAPEPEDGWFWIDTRGLSDGPHTVELFLLDAIGNAREATFAFVVDNTLPVVTLEVPPRSGTATVGVSGMWTDAIGPVDVDIFVRGELGAELVRPESRFSATVAVPCGGVPVMITAVAVDAAGNASAPRGGAVVCDAQGPQIVLQPTSFVEERDLVVSKDAAGTLVYAIPTGARTLSISENTAFPVVLEKYFTRLDDIPEAGGAFSANLPVLSFRFFDENGPIFAAGYRYLVGGRVVRSWTALDVGPNGDATIPISYQALSEELVLHDASVLHRIEVQAVDDVGNARTRAFDFRLDVLSPPVWFEDCASAPDLTWGGLPATYTTALSARAVTGAVRYVLDLPEGTLAPGAGVDLAIVSPDAESRIVEVSEQKFSEAWTAGWDGGACGPTIMNTRFHDLLEEWSQNTVCRTPGFFPEERVFWDVTVQGPVNDSSLHATRIVMEDALGTEIPEMNGLRRLAQGAPSTLTIELLSPRLMRAGAVYDWTTAYAAVPAGFTATVNVGGKYRLSDLSHSGRDTDAGGGSIMSRGFVTRASIHRFEVRTEPVGMTTVHSALPHASIEVRLSPSCDQAVVLELSE